MLFGVTSLPLEQSSWWRHQMGTFSALLALCAGNSPVTGEFPAQRPVMRSFEVFSDLRLNKGLSKQSWGWLFETPSRSLSCHCNDIAMPAKLPTLKVLGGIRTTIHNQTPDVFIHMIVYAPPCRTHFVSSIHSRRYTSWFPGDARSWFFNTYGTNLTGLDYSTHRPTLLYALRQLIRITQLTLFQNNRCLKT